jgi:hypothetical protein
LEVDLNTGNDERDRWYEEAYAMSNGLEPRDFEVAECAELPHELSHHSTAAAEDGEFQTEQQEWFEYLFEGDDQCLLLAIEQSCNDGMLLPWDMRAVRLRTAPPVVLSQLHWLIGACPRHVLVHLVSYVYWLVRSERARRRGRPDWTPSMPSPPLPDYEAEPSLKPMKSWPRHWP